MGCRGLRGEGEGESGVLYVVYWNSVGAWPLLRERGGGGGALFAIENTREGLIAIENTREGHLRLAVVLVHVGAVDAEHVACRHGSARTSNYR